MSEIVEDIKTQNIEVTSELGVTFSAENANIEHTGTGVLEIESEGGILIQTESEAIDSLKLEAEEGGILIQTESETNGTIRICSAKNVEICADQTNEEAIKIIAENGGISISAEGETTGMIEIEAEQEIIIKSEYDNDEAVKIIAEVGGISISAEGETNGIIEITAGCTNQAIVIEAENGNILIKTEAEDKNIVIRTKESGAVYVPNDLKAGAVYQAYDPETCPPNYGLLVPTGAVIPYAGGSSPAGWVMCDGQALSITDYEKLFETIGYTYGGGEGTFNVPDLRSRIPLGAGTGYGLSTRNLSETGGQEVITKVPPHTHDITDPSHSHSYSFPKGQTAGFTGDTVADEQNPNSDTTGSSTTGITVNNTGVNIQSPSVDVMNPFLVLNYIIKV